MSKRKYTKRNKEYWNSLSHKSEATQTVSEKSEVNPEIFGESWYETEASYTRTAATRTRTGKYTRNPRARKIDRYSNIERYVLPYDYTTGDINVRDTVTLCQKAYAYVPVVRNAVELMTEFSNADIYLDGGSKKSREFIKKWMERIKIWSIKDQYFREFFRSGNIFFYRLTSLFQKKEFQNIQASFEIENARAFDVSQGKIPTRYILLNPADIATDNALGAANPTYKKILSTFEIKKLKNPKTPHEREVYEALPEEAKKAIREGVYNSKGVYIPLDKNKLIPSFSKKQDYEPFAIPFGFPVLDDINWKLELKKVDQSIARSVENAILLITMGTDPEKGGINPRAMTAMKNLFQNESVGRVLVADYTTKASFVIPDLNKVLGKEKYEIVNKDIEDGLQNVIFADSKYSNNQIKTRVFLKRLKESRNAFLKDFLQDEIEMACKSVGLRDYPIAKFKEVDMADEVSIQRITTRLIELGILTPEHGLEAIKTKTYPTVEEMEESQEKFLEQREKGYYNPLVGGTPVGEEQDKGITPKPKEQKGRPVGKSAEAATFDPEKISQAAKKATQFEAWAQKEMKLTKKIKRLTKYQKQLISELCSSVISSSSPENWESVYKKCIKGEGNIDDLRVLPEILEISANHGTSTYEASLMFHSLEK